MGIRYRKSVKIAPGVRLNISKKGVGTSVGTKGFHVSTGPGGTRTTTSIPGTGISHTRYIGTKKKANGCLGVLVMAMLFALLTIIILIV